MPITIKISKLIRQSESGMSKVAYAPNLLGDQEQILGNNSITLENQSIDFSFKDSLSERELLQNPNILNKDGFSKVKNEDILLKDKFDTQDDPIFDLDDETAKMTQKNLNQANYNKSNIINKKIRSLKTSNKNKRY